MVFLEFAPSEQAVAGCWRGALQIPLGKKLVPSERRIHPARDKGTSSGWGLGKGEEADTVRSWSLETPRQEQDGVESPRRE